MRSSVNSRGPKKRPKCSKRAFLGPAGSVGSPLGSPDIFQLTLMCLGRTTLGTAPEGSLTVMCLGTKECVITRAQFDRDVPSSEATRIALLEASRPPLGETKSNFGR